MTLTASKLKQLRHADASQYGNRVWAAIKLAGEKQGAVAEALGFAQPYLSNVCRGRFADIGRVNAGKIADYFGCTIEDLFPSPTEKDRVA